MSNLHLLRYLSSLFDTILVWDALIVFLERKETFTLIRVGRISPVVDIYNGVRRKNSRTKVREFLVGGLSRNKSSHAG